MKYSTKIAICGLALLIGTTNASASHDHKKHGYKLTYHDTPKAEHNCLAILHNTALSSDKLAVFDVVASNPEYKIHGCMLDIQFDAMCIELVPVPGDDASRSILGPVSTAGFGGKLGHSIGAMDHDCHCRMATAIRPEGNDTKINALPAKGVVMRFALKLREPIYEKSIRPKVNEQNSGLISDNDQIIDSSIIRVEVGNLKIDKY